MNSTDAIDRLADDFWTATSLDEFSNASFVDRVVSWPDEPAVVDPLSGSAAPQRLRPVRDHFQRSVRRRRSGRNFGPRPVSHRQLERLLAAIGPTGDGRRTVGSAGGFRSVTAFVLCRSTSGDTNRCVVRYDDATHSVQHVTAAPDDDTLRTWCNLDGDGLPGVVVMLVAELGRLRAKYGPRGDRFALLEAGAVAHQLECRAAADRLVAHQLGGVRDVDVLRALGLDDLPVAVCTAVAIGHRG